MYKFMLLALLMGCSAKEKPVVNIDTEQKQNKEETNIKGQIITYWHHYTGIQGEVMNQIIHDFNHTNPYSIIVEAEYVGNFDDIYYKMINGLEKNNLPNIVNTNASQRFEYYDLGLIKDLTSYINIENYALSVETKENLINAFFEIDANISKGYRKNNNNNILLGLNIGINLDVLYYNKKILSDYGFFNAPKNWEEFINMSTSIYEKSNNKIYGHALNLDPSIMSSMVRLQKEIVTKDGYDFSDEVTINFIQSLKDLNRDGVLKRLDKYNEIDDFAQQKVAFTMGSSAAIPLYKEALLSYQESFDWGIALIPSDVPKASLTVISQSIIDASPEKELASWIFLKYLLSLDVQKNLVEKMNAVPLRKDVSKDVEEYFNTHPHEQMKYNLLVSNTIIYKPPFKSYEETMNIAVQNIKDIIDSKVIMKDGIDLINKKSKELFQSMDSQ